MLAAVRKVKRKGAWHTMGLYATVTDYYNEASHSDWDDAGYYAYCIKT